MKHGTIRIHENNLVIEAPPHVSIRLRRLFGGAQRYKAGVFQLAATPEHAYDLDWFSERHPMDVDAASEPRFRQLVADHERKMLAIAAIDTEGYVPREFELALPPRPYQRVAADLALKTGNLLIADDLGTGKLQPVDALVLTPSGYRTIGSLAVGDEVVGSSGNPTVVRGVFPQGIRKIYRVSFNDGSSVEAGDEHLWAVDYYRGGRTLSRMVVTTEAIRTGAEVVTEWPGRATTRLKLSSAALYLPMLQGPARFATAEPLPITPYLLGQLIANGGLAHGSATLTTNSSDWQEIERRLIAEGANLGRRAVYGMATRANVIGIMERIRTLDLAVLSRSKRIPPAYLRASVIDRIAMLHGLMDGDGSVSATRNRVTYSTTSSGLADDLRDLIEHLGGVATIHRADRSHDDKGVEYTVRVRLPSTIRPFSVTRKDARYAPTQRTEPTRRFSLVEYSRDAESVCIAVDAPDKLYATEHAILTHNTVSCICALTAPGALPAVIVTMTHLVRQWERELARFAPALRVHRIRSTQPYDFSDVRIEVDPTTRRRKVVRYKGMPDVVLLNYQKLHGWVETLAGAARTLIADEAQEFRHAGTRKYNAGKALAEAVDLRIFATATPIYNYGNEIFHVMDVVAPGQLGTWKEFLDEWCGGAADPQGRASVFDPAALGSYLREAGLMIRRTRKDVGREIPQLSVIRHEVECDEDPLNRVAADVAELARRILDRIGTPLDRMQAARDIDYQMRQATGIGKSGAVADFVRLLVESGERVVLSGWHHAVYSLWCAAFDRKGAEIPYALYTGNESEAQKEASRKRFIDGDAKVLIISNRAGAGLDGLQFVSRTVVVGELDWSPQVIHQLVGRVHRDGQTDPVTAYVIVTDRGSDPVISDAIGVKEAQSHYLLNPDASGMPEFTGASDDHIRKLAEDVLKRRGKAA